MRLQPAELVAELLAIARPVGHHAGSIITCCCCVCCVSLVPYVCVCVWLSFAGESQAEWFIEGLLERLTDPSDSIARHFLRDAIIYVMPNVCPDGTW